MTDTGATARMSMSPIVSFIRRSEPAWATRSAVSDAITCSASAMATPMCTLRPDCSSCSTPLARLARVLGPSPLTPARRPAAMASPSAAGESMPKSSNSMMAVFGPSDGTRVSRRTPSGTRPRRSSS